MDTEKVLLALVSAFGGWLLAQFTSIFKQKLQERRLKRAIMEEVFDLYEELTRSGSHIERALQIFWVNGVDASVPLAITMPIFEKHYGEAALYFNRFQRQSLQMLSTQLSAVNGFFKEYAEHLIEMRIRAKKAGAFTDEDIQRQLELIRLTLRAIYGVKWHISYHREHPLAPDFSIESPAHEEYREHLKKFQAGLDDFEDKARRLKPEQFQEQGPWDVLPVKTAKR